MESYFLLMVVGYRDRHGKQIDSAMNKLEKRSRAAGDFSGTITPKQKRGCSQKDCNPWYYWCPRHDSNMRLQD